jgi:hypothetical protein
MGGQFSTIPGEWCPGNQKRKIPKSSPGADYGSMRWTALLLVYCLNIPMLTFSLFVSGKETDPLDIQVSAGGKTHARFSLVLFDRNSGNLLMKYGSDDVKGGEKLRSMNYDLHTGAFAGLPTKVFAFFIALICASLPVTGFIVWNNKRKKVSPLLNMWLFGSLLSDTKLTKDILQQIIRSDHTGDLAQGNVALV